MTQQFGAFHSSIVIPGLVPGTQDRRRCGLIISAAAPSGITTEFIGSRHKAGNDHEKEMIGLSA